MGSRAALIIACLAAAACGDTSATPDMTASAQDMAFAPGGDLGHLGCSIPITVMPDQVAPPVTLTATAGAAAGGATMIQWDVQRSGDPAIPLTPASPLNASYMATQPGVYTFHIKATLASDTCYGSGSATVTNPTGIKVNYRLRALPPESLGVPLTDVPITITGGQPYAKTIVLDPGTSVSGHLVGPGGTGIAGEVRLVATIGPDALATADGSGAFKLAVLSTGTYQPLLVPQSTMLAPHLGASNMGINFAGATFSVAAGEPVTGSIVDNTAAPVANARVVLRAGALPSGVGMTSNAGTFALRAEQQTYGLSVGGDEWPIATLSGVTVPAGGVNIGIAYTVSRVAVGGSVVRSDGTTPVASTRVTIASRPLGTVANITVGGGGAQAASGRVLRQVITDANGNLPALQLPPGTYDLIVDPPADPNKTEGLTAITKTLAGAATWTLVLQPRVTLSGKVTDGNGNAVPNTQVTATELAGLGAAPTTWTGSDGSYSLSVDAGAALMVVFAPPPSVKLAGTKLSLAAGSTHADASLPPGLAVTGMVKDQSGAGLAAVIVEALPYSGGDTPITSDVTDGNGDFTLYLPDPGEIVDGGAP